MEKQKKQFKFNIIDVIIIVLIILAVVFFCKKFLGDREVGETVQITFYSEESPAFVVEQVKEGSPVYASEEKAYLGDVNGIEIGPAVTVLQDETSGEMTIGSNPINRSLTLSCVMHDAKLTNNGVVVGSTLFAPGHSLVIYAGQAKLYMRVYDLEKLD